MPIWKEGKATTTKVFDTFVALPGGALSSLAVVKVVWQDVQLNQSQSALLAVLCYQINYLGRAESWAEMRVIDDTSHLNNNAENCNAIPAKYSEKLEPEHERARVLVPLTIAEMEGFKAAIATLHLFNTIENMIINVQYILH